MASNSGQSVVDLAVQSAWEQAENIRELPRQLEASFATGDSAERRLGSIRSMCNRIRIGLLPVTNHIERNQPHLYREYLRRIELLLDGMQKCAIREIPEYSKTASKGDSPSGGARETAELAVVAMVLAVWLRQWAEELRTNHGQTQDSKALKERALSGGEGNENKQKSPSLGLNDIPPLDKENGEWVNQKEAAKVVSGETSTLRKERHHGLKAVDGLSGISTHNHFWRKESVNTKMIWYYKSSLSS